MLRLIGVISIVVLCTSFSMANAQNRPYPGDVLERLPQGAWKYNGQKAKQHLELRANFRHILERYTACNQQCADEAAKAFVSQPFGLKEAVTFVTSQSPYLRGTLLFDHLRIARRAASKQYDQCQQKLSCESIDEKLTQLAKTHPHFLQAIKFLIKAEKSYLQSKGLRPWETRLNDLYVPPKIKTPYDVDLFFKYVKPIPLDNVPWHFQMNLDWENAS